MTEASIVEWLKATRPHPDRPFKSDAVQPINPDGPEAAALIEELVEGLTIARDRLALDAIFISKIDALLAEVKVSKEEG